LEFEFFTDHSGALPESFDVNLAGARNPYFCNFAGVCTNNVLYGNHYDFDNWKCEVCP
jgi:hypothetical protein